MAGTREIARENGKKGGRPKGSTTKVRFADYVSEEDRQTFVEFMLSNYMGDMRLATWVGDQLYGKAPQSVDLTTKGEALPTPILNVLRDNSDKEGNETKEEN